MVTREGSRCPDCDQPMTSGGKGVAFLCGPGAPGVVDLPESPPRCVNPVCIKARDEAAMQRAIDAGIIDP